MSQYATEVDSVRNGKNYYISITIIGVFFFLFGFVTWLNSVLIPYFKIACQLNNFQAMFVAFAFYISYFFMALPSSWILNKTGLKKGMMLGLFVMSAGALIFIPAAMTRTYGLFLTGLFVIGTGLAILQTASNPYITIIGPIESAAKRISIMGICNKVAGAMAPLILAYFILNDADAFVANLKLIDTAQKEIALDSLASRVILPYFIIAIVLIALGILVKASPLPEVENESSRDEKVNGSRDKTSIFNYPHIWLGALALFFYVGVEVITGDTIIRYGMSLGIEIAKAKVFTTYTLISMILGYIVIGIILIPKIISQHKALQLSAILGIILTVMAIFTDGQTSVIFIALLGFANAIVWPAIWPLAIHNLGRHIKTGSAILIMAIAGGALLPLLWGKMTDLISKYPVNEGMGKVTANIFNLFEGNPQHAYWICVPCYLVILYFSMHGYKVKKW